MKAKNRFCLMLRMVARDPGTFHGYVGAGTHGDANLGLGERRRIVDPVASHRDDVTLSLEALDGLDLLLG